jgi:DDE superfamily endonuclease
LDDEIPTTITTIHVVPDNPRMHKGKPVSAWLAKHPRFVFHHLPVHCSWMNQMEQRFSNLQGKRLRIADFPEQLAAAERLGVYQRMESGRSSVQPEHPIAGEDHGQAPTSRPEAGRGGMIWAPLLRGGDRHPRLLEQRNQLLVHAPHGMPRVVVFRVGLEHFFHARHELGVLPRRDYPEFDLPLRHAIFLAPCEPPRD